ncbi:MAG: two-component system sensor histidine kinase NtrB, partial [Candidatus Binatia bacterium]
RLAVFATAASVFSHEIANPLNGISASVQILEKECQKGAVNPFVLKSNLRAVTDEIHRISSLLQDLRSFDQAQDLALKPTDPRELMRDVVAKEGNDWRQHGVEIREEFDGPLPPIMVDYKKMRQVIFNLCENAVEAMAGGGLLTLKGYCLGEAVVLEISDNGAGIPDGVEIFEPFQTTKLQGTGLGLSIVRAIVSRHKGSIKYVTEPGKGTSFKVFLPA